MKYLKWLLLLVIFIVIALISYVKFFLPNIKVNETLKVEITPQAIERGKYLANHVMLCMDCHSVRDWNKLSGPPTPGTLGAGGDEFTEEMGFPGYFYAPNITPNKLKDWSDGEIYRAITSGVNKDGKAIFPIMPYHSYGKIADEDIHAVIAYLRTLPSIKSTDKVSKSNFPMNIILNTIPKVQTVRLSLNKSNTLEYGKYLVTAGACYDCHTQMEKGKFVEGTEFSGGQEFPMPGGTLRSSNITPHETGIGTWSKKDFINKFKAFDLDYDTIPTIRNISDFNTIMPWTMYAGMTTEDLSAIYEYLMTLEPKDNLVEKFTQR